MSTSSSDGAVHPFCSYFFLLSVQAQLEHRSLSQAPSHAAPRLMANVCLVSSKAEFP